MNDELIRVDVRSRNGESLSEVVAAVCTRFSFLFDFYHFSNSIFFVSSCLTVL